MLGKIMPGKKIRKTMRRVVVAVVAVCLSPMIALAQATSSGGIAGVVRDTTGAVLPGVTVEAASSALIEKVRTVVTDEQGQYKILELRPGVYSVTFTLPGFRTVKREGIELTTGFTATVNADLTVGAVEETVTVTGASPLVDTQNVRTQTVVSRQILDVLPTTKSMPAFAAFTVGANLASCCGLPQDVGGNRAEVYGEVVVHGGRTGEAKQMIDGMSYNLGRSGGGADRFMRPNEAFIQEVTLTTSGLSAETLTGGMQENVVPKDGGNRFSVYFAAAGTNGDLQSNNLTDDARARGLTTVSTLKNTYDVGGGVGGPIKRDRLWFYMAHRRWGSSEFLPGRYYSAAPNTIGPFIPDLSRPAFNDQPITDYSGRLTWQITAKQKVATNQIYQENCQCHISTGFQAGEALRDVYFRPLYLGQYIWSYVTNRLLFEAGATQHAAFHSSEFGKSVAPDAISITELSNGLTYNAPALGITAGGGGALSTPPHDDLGQNNARVGMSYVTGSHAFKVGFTLQYDHIKTAHAYVPSNVQGYPVYYNFRNGSPAQVVQWASPSASKTNAHQYAAYAQDQWTLKKLTINAGVRFDKINGFVPEQDRPGGVFVPAFHISQIDNVPNFTDVSPRLGVAYDVFGNGKTAVKASVGRFLASLGASSANVVNPVNAVAASTTRTWTDANNNFVPDCDLPNRAANGECGAIDNRAFGTVLPGTTFDKSVIEGFGNRVHNWQLAASVQQELRPGLAVNVGYFRTGYGNFTVVDNVLVTPADFTSFCMSAPSDPRLPNGGGYQICDLSDVNPGKFGQVQNVVTKASNFGTAKEVYNGVDATMQWRFGQGGLLMGGMNVGRKLTQCVAPDAPVQFCRQLEPWLTQVKFSGSYPLPWGLAVSGVFQNLAGERIATRFGGNATWVVTNAQVSPLLGRNLAAGPNGVKAIQLYDPSQEYEDRLNQLDLRLSKVLLLQRVRVQPKVDVYNVFNNAAILGTVSTFPRNYLLPQQILGGRLLKFAVQVDF